MTPEEVCRARLEQIEASLRTGVTDDEYALLVDAIMGRIVNGRLTSVRYAMDQILAVRATGLGGETDEERSER